MAIKERRIDPTLAQAKGAGMRRLLSKLEAAHRSGSLKPVSPKSKPVTMEIRVKVA